MKYIFKCQEMSALGIHFSPDNVLAVLFFFNVL